MSWRYVFDSKLLAGSTKDEIINLTYLSKYKFFNFNGNIYFLASKTLAYPTGLTVRDMKA